MCMGGQNPRPVPAKNAGTRTGHPLAGSSSLSLKPIVHADPHPALGGKTCLGGQNPRPVPAKNAGTRTGHPLAWVVFAFFEADRTRGSSSRVGGKTCMGGQNPRPVPAENAGTRTGHPLAWVVFAFFEADRTRGSSSRVGGKMCMGGQNPRPVPAENAGTRTGHPLSGSSSPSFILSEALGRAALFFAPSTVIRSPLHLRLRKRSDGSCSTATVRGLAPVLFSLDCDGCNAASRCVSLLSKR